jgi:hypothetical protein
VILKTLARYWHTKTLFDRVGSKAKALRGKQVAAMKKAETALRVC